MWITRLWYYFSLIRAVPGGKLLNPFPYEKDDRHQHAPYPRLLPDLAIVDMGLDGITLA
jgi:hypothetical protein